VCGVCVRCVCVCVCVYTCVCVCIHTHTHTHTCVCTYIRIYTFIRTQCMNTNVYTYVYTLVYTYVYTYVHACIHTYIHTYIRLHTYIHSYTEHSLAKQTRSQRGIGSKWRVSRVPRGVGRGARGDEGRAGALSCHWSAALC